METAGLRVNYSRVHPGQGTTNLCACLEDVFLELIWLDGSDISTESERITLGARGRGAGLPIGVSWRGDAPFEAEPDHIESYAAPFLRTGVTIPVAAGSLDRRMPFFFRTPGGVPPAQRSDELVGNRQLPHYAVLMDLELSLPNADAARSLLGSLSRLKVVEGLPGLRFTLVDPQGTPRHRVVWTV